MYYQEHKKKKIKHLKITKLIKENSILTCRAGLVAHIHMEILILLWWDPGKIKLGPTLVGWLNSHMNKL